MNDQFICYLIETYGLRPIYRTDLVHSCPKVTFVIIIVIVIIIYFAKSARVM